MDTAREIRKLDEEARPYFVTTSSDHAVDSYGVRASGYLIKPFTYEAFGETMRLARLGKIMNARFIALGDDRILLKEILWCDRDGHYVQIHTDMQGVLRYRVAFASLEAVLSAYPQFLPCYRGLIINMDRVRRMEELEFLMDTGERVPFRKRTIGIKSRFHSICSGGQGGGFVMIDIAMTLLFPFLDFIPFGLPRYWIHRDKLKYGTGMW